MEKKYVQKKWSLEDILPHETAKDLDTYFSGIEKDVVLYEKYRGNNPKTKEEVGEAMALNEKITVAATKIGAYASLKEDEDVRDQDAKAFADKAKDHLTEIQNRTLFLSLWWKGIDDEEATKLLPENEEYAHALTESRKMRKYTLSEDVEKTINIKDKNGASELIKIYDDITNSFMFTIRVDGKTIKENGKTRKFTRDELAKFAKSTNPKEREGAYKSLYGKYGENSRVLGSIYKAVVKDRLDEGVGMRKYESSIGMKNISNDVPDEAVNALLQACRENRGIFHDFFRLKAKMLGTGKLRRYDIFAPIKQIDRKVEFDEGLKTVFEAFDNFHPEFGRLGRKPFDEGHVDSEIREGKRNGAFCAGMPSGITPYIMLNYTGKIDDVFTAAHEDGHAIHDMKSEKHSIFNAGAPLPLAETASTFAEAVLSDHLMERETDKEVKKYMLAKELDDMYGTVMRQAYFTIFEKDAHEMIAKGTTVDELSGKYMENLREQFGDAVDVSDEFKNEWIIIPHIYHTPFYCYAYSFGNLLALSLYDKCKKDPGFKESYFKILEYGGSESPEKILSEVGIDIKSKEFWQGGFDVIKSMVNELREMD
ncbi:MAG: M3 family oligoendopeptidase [Candidatus Aenigmarchaeota archaeon]|nr:M3 family oligoendopeptidase [Candidatus Aenigmarchaeota archaeon]